MTLPSTASGADRVTPAERSRIMRAVKCRDTRPERLVRSIAWSLGLRHRLGGCGLPGRPDLAYPGRKRAVFVHGCFWHGHDCARGARAPKANAAYWAEKIARNRARDGRALTALDALGYESLVIWECQLKDRDAVRAALARFLAPPAERP